MLPFIFLGLIAATDAKSVDTKFTVQGGGSLVAGKLSMDIHVETKEGQVLNSMPNGPTTATVGSSATPAPAGSTPAPAGSTPVPAGPTPASPGTTPTTPPVNATAPGATATTVLTTAAGATGSAGPATSPPGMNSTMAPTTPAPAGSVSPPAGMYPDKGSSGNSKMFSDIDRTALELHNYYRSIHEAPLLSLDESLRKDAQDYAYKVAKSQLLRPEQDSVLTSKDEGENLGFRCSVTRPEPSRALRQIMKRWYDEGCNYKFREPLSDRFGHRHFTQLTWNGSKKLGVGVAYGRVKNLQCLYFVARYRPRGNTGAKLDYVKNVRKGVFDSSFCKPVPNHLSKQEVVLKD